MRAVRMMFGVLAVGVGLCLAGCENQAGVEEQEREVPQADVEVGPEGAADVDVKPNVTPAGEDSAAETNQNATGQSATGGTTNSPDVEEEPVGAKDLERKSP